MDKLRTVAAYILLAVLLAATLALLERPAALDAPGEYPVTVDGPDGTIWNGTVQVADPTPLGALLAAADAGDFTVEVRGSGPSAYVVGVDGHREGSGGAGWCYAIERGGAWSHPSVGADVYGLREGEAVRWHYAEGPDECGEPSG